MQISVTSILNRAPGEEKGGGLSDHFLVEARLKLVGGWRSVGRMEGVRNMLKGSELNHSVKERHTRRACLENMKCGEGVGKVQRYGNGVCQ